MTSTKTEIMPRRRFGRTELQLSVFTCGGMRFQHSWDGKETGGVTAEKQSVLYDLVERGLELGINHFETARGYGTSEFELGGVLPSIPRDRFNMQTKVGPKATAKEFRDTFHQSLKNLKLDYLDLFTLHGINNPELLGYTLGRGGCLEEALKLKEQGLCRFVGFSTHAPLHIITQCIDTGMFDYINIHWYFVQQVNWPAVQAARDQDMGVFIISPNDKGGKLYEPSNKLRELCKPLTPMQFNDLWCLSRDEVHTLSLGASKAEDFDEHVEGLRHYEGRKTLTATVAQRLESAMREQLGDDWFERWRTGIPEFTEVKGEINIREIIRLWNLAKGLDMIEYGKMRYNLLGNGGHWFPGANANGVKDKHLAPYLKHSPFAERIPGILREAHEMLVDRPKERLTRE